MTLRDAGFMLLGWFIGGLSLALYLRLLSLSAPRWWHENEHPAEKWRPYIEIVPADPANAEAERAAANEALRRDIEEPELHGRKLHDSEGRSWWTEGR